MARHSERRGAAPQVQAHPVQVSARQRDGAAAEALAARFLQAQGLRVIGRNLRWKDGELDLVCEHGDVLVFVEVRMRRDSRFGGAAASVGHTKQARLIRAAQHWLAAQGPAVRARPARFDVIALPSLDPAGIDWIRDAFTA